MSCFFSLERLSIGQPGWQNRFQLLKNQSVKPNWRRDFCWSWSDARRSLQKETESAAELWCWMSLNIHLWHSHLDCFPPSLSATSVGKKSSQYKSEGIPAWWVTNAGLCKETLLKHFWALWQKHALTCLWYRRLMCLEIGRSSLQIRNFATWNKNINQWLKLLFLNVSVIIISFDLIFVSSNQGQVCKWAVARSSTCTAVVLLFCFSISVNKTQRQKQF